MSPLAPRDAGAAHHELQGRATVAGAPLLAPASGVPCAFWRLRIVEVVAPGLEFVHEVGADADLCIALDREGGLPRQVIVPGARARVVVPPILHRPGSDGARAVARELGLAGELYVEEFLLRLHDEVSARGILVAPEATIPTRAVHRAAELWQAEVRLADRPRPVRLLPWAVGTGALILGALGGAAALLRKMEALSSASRKMGQLELRRPQELRPPRHARDGWP